MEERRTNGCRMGKKSKAALLVSKSCYKAAFKLLWSAKGARKPMMDFWSKQLNEEVRTGDLSAPVCPSLVPNVAVWRR